MSMEHEYFICDCETGYRTPVSKETWEAYRAWMSGVWEQAMSRLQDDYKGQILVGTMGDFEKGNLQEIFTSVDLAQEDKETTASTQGGEAGVVGYFHPVFDQYDKFGQLKENP